MNKKELSEQDVRSKYILPAIVDAGWDLHEQIREEVTIAEGRVIVQGQKAQRATMRRADYVLSWKSGVPLAIVEAKDNNHPVGGGMEQALEYARKLDLPFAFSSNGDGFVMHDRTGQGEEIESTLALEAFPKPAVLWARYQKWKGLAPEQLPLITQDFYEQDGRELRYYQVLAVNRALEAVACGQRRVLLVMATGTGKTRTAFQIAWRLMHAKRVKRVLFLTDRDALATQAMTNDFAPFASVMTRIEHRNADKAFEVYVALYQSLVGDTDASSLYRTFSRQFFDLVIIDECHRGSADDDAPWRQVLEYFSDAIQLGLTATPRETRTVSNTAYFGEPVYTYSLKQGIADGFLAPYKVIRVDLDRDLDGWRPAPGQFDDYRREIEQKEYTVADFDRLVVLVERTKRVAQKVVELLRSTDPFAKTIVFCEDIDHAERMRSALVNAAKDLVKEHPNYIARITGEKEDSRDQLDLFTTSSERFPVIVTTSELLTTGIDAKTCRYVVIDQTIRSMTKFKQVIGRGTRIEERFKKLFFTIVDFRRVTLLFRDPEFDGDPVVVYEPPQDAPLTPSEDAPEDPTPSAPPGPQGTIVEGATTAQKYFVSGVTVTVVAERVSYYGPQGKLITESLKDYTRSRGRSRYASLDAFLQRWNEAEKKKAIIDELKDEGVLLDALRESTGNADLDAFDLICHIVFDRPAVTRRQRAEHVRKRDAFARYGEKARAVLNALLDKYAEEGIEPIEEVELLRVPALEEYGTLVEILQLFGGKKGYMAAVNELERELYRPNGFAA